MQLHKHPDFPENRSIQCPKPRKWTPPNRQHSAPTARNGWPAIIPVGPTVKLPLGALELSNPDALAWLQKWQKSAYDAGLIGCDYPKELGGGGMENCQSIANAEMQRAQTPYLPNIIGMGMAAPTVLFHARDEVKAELLPKLLSR